MPEVADAFRRFGSSYDEVHGAAMLPSHRRAITDIIACRTEVVLQSLRRSAARLPLLPQPRLPEVSHRADAGLARTASGGDVAGSLFPRHRHRARGIADRPAPSSGQWLWRPDEGRRHGDHRSRPRSALDRRHGRRAGCAAHLDAAADLEPSLMMPGIIISLI